MKSPEHGELRRHPDPLGIHITRSRLAQCPAGGSGLNLGNQRSSTLGGEGFAVRQAEGGQFIRSRFSETHRRGEDWTEPAAAANLIDASNHSAAADDRRRRRPGRASSTGFSGSATAAATGSGGCDADPEAVRDGVGASWTGVTSSGVISTSSGASSVVSAAGTGEGTGAAEPLRPPPRPPREPRRRRRPELAASCWRASSRTASASSPGRTTRTSRLSLSGGGSSRSTGFSPNQPKTLS